MEVFSDKKTSKNIYNFYCNICDFGCYKKGDWTRHIMTRKHIKVTPSDSPVTKKTSNYVCSICYKIYASRNGLWKHGQKCTTKCDKDELNSNEKDTYIIEGINIKDKDALLIHLLKQNSELHHKIIQMTSQTNNTTNNNNNSHNTTNNITPT